MKADTLPADKAFDADKRVIEPLRAEGKTAVIPPKATAKLHATTTTRDDDKEIYKARHLVDNFLL